MKALTRTALIVAIGLGFGGCSIMESKQVAREDLKNMQGHVVGFKDVIRSASGEEIAQISLFVPRVGERGEIVGYEERVRGGSVLRDVTGKRIGARFVDARSRGTNPQSKGLLIVVRGKQADTVATAQAPNIDDLIHLARLGN